MKVKVEDMTNDDLAKLVEAMEIVLGNRKPIRWWQFWRSASYGPKEWDTMGAIMDRDKIDVNWWPSDNCWRAQSTVDLTWNGPGSVVKGSEHAQAGVSALAAVCRCYVSIHYGNEVEMPETGEPINMENALWM